MIDALLISAKNRWYVLLFLGSYIVLAVRHLGVRRVLLFTGIAACVSWLSEVPSIRIGFPYGRYDYIWGGPSGIDPSEPALLGVPCFSTLSYVFLNYSAYCTALAVLGLREGAATSMRARAAISGLSAVLVVALDTVIDPVALRGDRWFLGRIYLYPGGGEHFGVPITNYAGWLLVGAAIAGLYSILERRLIAEPPPRGSGPPLGAALYASILAFNIGVTFWIGERELAWSSTAVALPIVAVVLARLASKRPE